jgi:hypothetical protein
MQKRFKVGSVVQIRSMNLQTKAEIVAVEGPWVTLRTIHGKVVGTHIRNIRPL